MRGNLYVQSIAAGINIVNLTAEIQIQQLSLELTIHRHILDHSAVPVWLESKKCPNDNVRKSAAADALF